MSSTLLWEIQMVTIESKMDWCAKVPSITPEVARIHMGFCEISSARKFPIGCKWEVFLANYAHFPDGGRYLNFVSQR